MAEGSQNRGQTRGKLIELLRRAGIEHPSPQPSKAQLLELCRIHKIDPNGGKAACTITQFIPTLQPCANASKAKEVPAENIQYVPDSADEDDDFSDEDILLNQEGASINIDPITLKVCNQQTNYQQQLTNRPGWYNEVGVHGYAAAGITAPNKAVQTVLGCIMLKELHKVFITKECELVEGDISAILFLGFDRMLDLVCSFKSKDFDHCKDLIEQAYLNLPAAHIQADSNDVFDLLSFIKGLTILEKTNSLKISYPPNDSEIPAVNETENSLPLLDNCLFDLSMIPVIEQIPAVAVPAREDPSKEDLVKTELLRYNIKEMNLFNCGPFPIMTSRNVEIHGEQFQHTLWNSKNLDVLAPISKESLIMLARLQKDEVLKAESNALSCIKPFKRIDYKFPFKLDFLGRTCELGNGLFIGQKGHMAKVEEKRIDFYLKKIWRTYCPFVKCNCDKISDKKCPDNINWFDQLLWHMLNNLEKIWPNDAIHIRFARFSSFLSSEPIKTVVLAYIGYLSVRKILIDMTHKFAEADGKTSYDFKQQFGNYKVIDVLEKTIKPISFLYAHQHDNASLGYLPGRKRAQTNNTMASGILRPPKLTKSSAGSSSSSATSRVTNIGGNTNIRL